MRKGFTTGSCAAAASKAAAYMLFGGRIKEQISINTPAGIVYETKLEDIRMEETRVSCAVRKDAGDDPDITDKALICSTVSLINDGNGEVVIEGGEGVGTVTRPGLDQPVGNAAINSVPRQMITEEVLSVMELFDVHDSVKVVISVPEGKELAARTFNPRLGIEGGISIIGTSGIVEPMSTAALLDTIRVELRQLKALGVSTAVIAPGNYGLDFMRERYGYDLDKAVKCSNYIGETIDMIRELGFKRAVLVGHVGKLIKLSGGIMNTHSKEADCRMELMAAAAVYADAPKEVIKAVLESVSTEAACDHLTDAGILDRAFEHVMDRIAFYLDKRAGGEVDIRCIVFSNKHGLLGATAGAEEMLAEAK